MTAINISIVTSIPTNMLSVPIQVRTPMRTAMSMTVAPRAMRPNLVRNLRKKKARPARSATAGEADTVQDAKCIPFSCVSRRFTVGANDVHGLQRDYRLPVHEHPFIEAELSFGAAGRGHACRECRPKR